MNEHETAGTLEICNRDMASQIRRYISYASAGSCARALRVTVVTPAAEYYLRQGFPCCKHSLELRNPVPVLAAGGADVSLAIGSTVVTPAKNACNADVPPRSVAAALRLLQPRCSRC